MARSDTDPSPVLGDEIERQRRMLGLSQSQLAHDASVSLSTVQRAERGDGTLRYRTLAALADALGVPLATIFTGAVTGPVPVNGHEPAWAQVRLDRLEAALRDANEKLDQLLAR